MRILSTILIIALCFSWAIADEVTVSLDRVAVLVPDSSNFNNFSSRIAVHFTLPDDVDETDIIYAEMHIPLNFTNIQIVGDSILEFQARNITTDWTEQNASWSGPWTNAGGDLDTLTFYTYTITMTDTADIFMDVTKFVRPIVESGSDNFGLMLIPLKYDQRVFHLNQNVGNYIKNSTSLRIVYH